MKPRAQILKESILLYAHQEKMCQEKGDMFSFQYWQVKRNAAQQELKGMS